MGGEGDPNGHDVEKQTDPSDGCVVQRQNQGAEHLATRDNVGLFDLTGLSIIEVRGAGALKFVDYLCSNSMRDDADYVAARWTVAGSHGGGTLWGAPTQAPLLVLGESQYRIVDGKVAEEWLVFDELAVLTQVARARHAA